MHIYILRHGQTAFNKLGIIQGSSVDTDLDDTGRQQAEAFFKEYQHIDFQLIVTSVLKRTHQTVRQFIERGTPWIQTPDINEIRWGDHEGEQINDYWNSLFTEVRDSWNSGNLDARLPGGESAAELNTRLDRFIEWIKTRPEQRILVCSHGRTMRGLISLLKGISLAEMEGVSHSNTGCYICRYNGTRFEFSLENGLEHLRWMDETIQL
jgi:phosphoserine phosphatase